MTDQFPADGQAQIPLDEPPTAPLPPQPDPTPPAAQGVWPGYEPPSAPPAPAANSSGLGLAIVFSILTALIVGAAAGFGGGLVGARFLKAADSGGAGGASIAVTDSKTDEPVVAAAAAAVPAVVNIDVTQGASTGDTSGLPNSHPNVPVGGNGSGVAFRSAPGGGTYILTNNHVVESATSITVGSPAGKAWPGTVVGRDVDSDIAVVKIPGQLPTIKLGDSKNLQVGQTVVAIGSPYGLEHSVTSGIISALGRTLSDVNSVDRSQPLIDTIQTDAAINPGNSGGALVDLQGRLIGVNAAIYSESGSAAGIGFAVPIDTAMAVADQIIAGRKVTHPFIGLVGSTITPMTASQKKLPVQQGALVESVMANFGAAKAGVRPGDIVTAVDGVKTTSMTGLVAQVREHVIGTDATLTVLRKGKTLSLKVKILDRPSEIGSSVPSTSTVPTEP
jgi:putative serine protease PepD